MVRNQCEREPWNVNRIGALAAIAAALLALPLAGGCAQSASTGWAQRSAAIAPSERPPALSAFVALAATEEEAEDEVR